MRLFCTQGGLRGVVITDTMQAILMIATPTIIFVKMFFDSATKRFPHRREWDANIEKYILE